MLFGLSRKFRLSPYGMQAWFQANSDGGQGSGKGDDGNTEDDSGGDDAKKNGKKPEVTFTEEQQAVVNKLVGDARTKEREKAKADLQQEADKEKKRLEEEALEKNKEWERLAATRAQELETVTKERDELFPLKDTVAKYKGVLDKMVAEAKKSVPKHLLPLLDKMDPVEALDYLTDHAKELNVKPRSYPETPDDKEKSLSKDDEASGKRANQQVITSSF